MSDKKKPSVSVVITNYNYAIYLEQAVESVISQTYKNIKLFIYDDSSTDDSLQVLKQFENKAEIIRHKKNKGIVETRNEAIRNVDTDFIIFLDADDWIEPDYVALLVEDAIRRRLDIAYCDARYFINTKDDMGQSLSPPEFNLERLKNGNFIHITSLIRVAALGDVEFDRHMEKITHEDWDFFLHLGLRGLNFGLVDGVVLNYRVKPNNRNMHLDNEIGFASLYSYIYEKYSKIYPEQFNYLAYGRFVLPYKDTIEELTKVSKELHVYRHRYEHYKDQLDAVRGSKSYQLGRLGTLPLRAVKKLLKLPRYLAIRAIKFVQDSNIYSDVITNRFEIYNKKASSESYFLDKDGEFQPKSRFAAIIHLYHIDRWGDAFRDKLLLLKRDLDIDLYFTIPEANKVYIQEIRETFPDANFLVVPNKGRDVLPFIKTAALLDGLNYKKILKLHSKKSKHRDGYGNAAESGDDWLAGKLEGLIPEDDKLRAKLIKILNSNQTGMIGVAKYYYPLSMYLRNNLIWMRRILKMLDDRNLDGWNASSKVGNIGYFGGTMFWVDLSSIRPLLNISKENFQRERGQIDGTLAHALERALCIAPQNKQLDIYGVSSTKIEKMSKNRMIKPAWYREDISGGKPPISIVVPVYSDWWSLSKNIKSLKKLIPNSEDITVHYVNDCGPDADLIEDKIKQSISGMTNFFYYRNSQNLGFVKTCNHAVNDLISETDDVLLLNSDTKVTKNFVTEMRAVLYHDDEDNDVGAVTSRSNNATIWSVPMTSKLANLRWLSYALYRLIKITLPDYYITPTIHGFCVLIRREVIDKYGLFDEIYGKGYGEENDFAMRIRTHGWQTAVSNKSFVFHYESRSFGSEARNKQIEVNEKVLMKRYPTYRKEVQDYWNRIKEPFK